MMSYVHTSGKFGELHYKKSHRISKILQILLLRTMNMHRKCYDHLLLSYLMYKQHDPRVAPEKSSWRVKFHGHPPIWIIVVYNNGGLMEALKERSKVTFPNP